MEVNKAYKIGWIVGLLVGLFIALLALIAYSLVTKPVQAEPFDHSDCQYPYRLSNPIDGCDNSDPANPECIKGGMEECESAPVYTPPVETPTTAPTQTPNCSA